ncbi:MAG: metal-dependent hydrolase [Rhodomicrobium sp.]|nr:MAG: metal-dependent hydrolase [Rhodomicrobium sp.]
MRWAPRLKSGTLKKLQHGEVIALENFEVPIEFRRHPKARRLTLRVSATNRSVIITAPPFCSDHETISFLERHRSWLHQQIEKLPEPAPYKNGSSLPLRGVDHQIIFAGKTRGKGVVWTCNEDKPTLYVAGNEEFAPRRLQNWLRKEARSDLVKHSCWHAENLGVTFRKIMIKDQRSRWGSCSSRLVLSYSWRLILAPPNVLEYVAAHEVAHLLEMNHGPNFWKLVAKTMPEYEDAKNWLRAEGMNLHRYGASS